MVAQLPAVITDPQYPAVVRQAALDSFYVHVRTLIEYLEVPKPPQSSPRPPDFKASGYVQGWTPPTDTARNARLNDYWTDASKHVVHFSQVRPLEGEKTDVEIRAIADDVLAVWQDLHIVATPSDGLVPTKVQLAVLDLSNGASAPVVVAPGDRSLRARLSRMWRSITSRC
jgi:hypothetical protein